MKTVLVKLSAIIAFIVFTWFMLREEDITFSNYPNYGSPAYHRWPDSWFVGISIYDNSFYWFFGGVIVVTAFVTIMVYKKIQKKG